MRRKAMAKREPNGKPKRSSDELLLSPVEVQRLRAAAAQGLRDAIWSSMLGYLLMTGKITSAQFAAGKRWSQIAAEYEQVMLSPRQPQSPQIERTMQGVGVEQVVRDVTARLTFSKAYAVLVQSGLASRQAVIRVCENNDAPHGHNDLLALRAGLDALSLHWMQPQKKRQTSG